MKKLLFIVVLVGLSIPAFNQVRDSVLLNKNGINILPEKGDIAIGIDAVPFLNLINSKGNNPGFNFINNIPSISLKYFNSNHSALIMDFIVGYSSVKDGDEDLTQFSQDTKSSIGINFGYEKRLGKSRVQGFYGVEGGFIYGKSKNIDANKLVTLETSSIGVGASFILGAEVFVAAKLSVGGQFSWGPQYLVEKDIDNRTKMSGFTMGADNANAALILAFHF
jgi:hypothetical protein